ncbi:MAG TPA: PP2C family serine/threonine-protein phosphatase [Acidimicrobiales bacterium]|jgi:PPM family protein phosphatase|nr:PP2C family serine/threonine-protein phosphatase [Acidimicrobiales bacterium]
MTVVRAAAHSDTGRRRQKNDDTPFAGDRLFAVADGMGGYAGGEVASSTAIEVLRKVFGDDPTAEGLEDAVLQAGRAVQQRSQSDPDLRQMGTTLSAVALVDSPDGEVFAVAHIGDSRIYLLRDGELSQLTDDHTVPEDLKRAGQLSEEEAAVDPRRHIITRVLGPSGEHAPDMQTLVPYAGDRLLLCSDGLTDELSDDQIASILRSVADPDETARRLVEQANQHGGRDNVTVVVVDVLGDDDRSRTASAALAAAGDRRTSTPSGNADASRRGLMTAEERNAELRRLARGEDDDGPAPWENGNRTFGDDADLPSRRFTFRVALFVLVLLAVLGASAGAVWWYATNSYFVGLDDGRVAIFKGRPGGLLFIQPEVVETTDLTEAAVPPARADDVAEGHTVGSLEDAQRYVRNLRRDAGVLTPSPTTSVAPADPSAATTTTAGP